MTEENKSSAFPERWGSKTYIMGIINCTPDSFSGDGVLQDGSVEAAVDQALKMEAEGADILDMGGESTKPGATPVTAEEELRRVIPVITAVRAKSKLPISIDTSKALVAQEALRVGANCINDVWATRADPEMENLMVAANVPVILMHNRSKKDLAVRDPVLGGRYEKSIEGDVTKNVTDELWTTARRLTSRGLAAHKIILDPGLGFGKTIDQSMEILRRLAEVRCGEFALLSGPSRKSFIGYTLNLPVEDRLEGTLAAVAISIQQGADIVRVHDVKSAKRVAAFCDALFRNKPH